jgi:hypothetical protein
MYQYLFCPTLFSTPQAKMLGDQFPKAKKGLEDIGYVVADFAQDGFALLKAEMIFAPGPGGVNGHLKGVTLAEIRNKKLAILST